MDKQSFYRYVNAYNHYQNDKNSFDKFYEFPVQYTEYNFIEKNQFLEKTKFVTDLSNKSIKFYLNNSVINYLIQENKFVLKWIHEKPSILPFNEFYLQINRGDGIFMHLNFITVQNKKLVTISYDNNGKMLFDSTLYELDFNNFDMLNVKNMTIGVKENEKHLKNYQENIQINLKNIMQSYMYFYMSIYAKDIFEIQNNTNKKEKKIYKHSRYNYTDYNVVKIRDKIYKNFTKNNKGKKQKSWHMVMSHLRQLQNGKITTVKAHSRGSKKIGIRLKDYEVSKGK
jgi:hypothetical protein